LIGRANRQLKLKLHRPSTKLQRSERCWKSCWFRSQTADRFEGAERNFHLVASYWT